VQWLLEVARGELGYQEGSRGYTFACEVPMPLPMAYTRRGEGSLAALFGAKCAGNSGEI